MIPTAWLRISRVTSRTTVEEVQGFDPQYDIKTSIFVAGHQLAPFRQRIINPMFVLPTPEIVAEYEPELARRIRSLHPGPRKTARRVAA